VLFRRRVVSRARKRDDGKDSVENRRRGKQIGLRKMGRIVEGCKQTRERKALDETKSYAHQGEGDEGSWEPWFRENQNSRAGAANSGQTRRQAALLRASIARDCNSAEDEDENHGRGAG
jgi:hypothetical protein